MPNLLETSLPIDAEYEDHPDTAPDPVTELRQQFKDLSQFTAGQLQEFRKRLERIEYGLGIAIGKMSQAVAPAGDNRKAAVWESWKQKLGGKQAEFIEALLTHGEMSAIQLKIATRSGQQTVYDTIHKLNKLGLINKNGGKFSLKEV